MGAWRFEASTNVEGSQVFAIPIEGVVVELGELLCVVLSSSRPAEGRFRKAAVYCTYER